MTQPIRLWDGPAPGALGDDEKDIPALSPHLVEGGGLRAAVLIFPGGGYGMLADHEGSGYARWLNANGFHAFVLRYRLGTAGYRHPAMLQDAARAMRIIRARASEWSVDPGRVAVIGSSAGGHLASTILTKWDTGDPAAKDPVERFGSRPDAGILCYAVIDLSDRVVEKGSRRNLLGPEPSAEKCRELSADLHVRADTPPCFVWHTAKDPVVQVRNAYLFAEALGAAGVSYELHVYDGDIHGIGLGSAPGEAGAPHPWAPECIRWLKTVF